MNLYYLSSRYYDQNTGRFINADSYVSTGTGLLGYNMYAYCNNNPVMMVDSSGKGPISILALVLLVGVTIITLTSCGSSESDELSYNYAATENDVVDDKINYRIDPGASDGSTEPQIVIYNSYNYTSRSEQKRILKYIIDTDRAQETGLSSDDIDYYIKEWSVHNYAYYHPSLAAMVKGCSVDSAKESARHVNLNTDDPAAAYYKWFGGLIGVFY